MGPGDLLARRLACRKLRLFAFARDGKLVLASFEFCCEISFALVLATFEKELGRYDDRLYFLGLQEVCVQVEYNVRRYWL